MSLFKNNIIEQKKAVTVFLTDSEKAILKQLADAESESLGISGLIRLVIQKFIKSGKCQNRLQELNKSKKTSSSRKIKNN